MPETVTHWTLREDPATKTPNYNFQEVGQEYRGFLVSRANSEYLLWTIETLEGTKPPIPLRSAFTMKSRATKAIDDFLEDEKNKTVAKGDGATFL